MITTNILALPAISMDVETGTNEDWIDSLVYLVPADIEHVPGQPVTDRQQIDLRGIRFTMHVRRAPEEHEVILEASTETTDTGSLFIPPPPDFGFLVINIPMAEMRKKIPGIYAGDIVGRDDMHERVIVRFKMIIVEGITRWVQGRPLAFVESPPVETVEPVLEVHQV